MTGYRDQVRYLYEHLTRKTGSSQLSQQTFKSRTLTNIKSLSKNVENIRMRQMGKAFFSIKTFRKTFYGHNKLPKFSIDDSAVAALAVIILVGVDIRQIEQRLTTPNISIVRAHAHCARVEINIPVQVQQGITQHQIHCQAVGGGRWRSRRRHRAHTATAMMTVVVHMMTAVMVLLRVGMGMVRTGQTWRSADRPGAAADAWRTAVRTGSADAFADAGRRGGDGREAGPTAGG
jgi:hypothetical protein